MPQRASPLPFPHGRDGIVHLVMDCAAHRKTVVADLLSGRYRHPLRDETELQHCSLLSRIAYRNVAPRLPDHGLLNP
jgi:hypothetical protein